MFATSTDLIPKALLWDLHLQRTDHIDPPTTKPEGWGLYQRLHKLTVG